MRGDQQNRPPVSCQIGGALRGYRTVREEKHDLAAVGECFRQPPYAFAAVEQGDQRNDNKQNREQGEQDEKDDCGQDNQSPRPQKCNNPPDDLQNHSEHPESAEVGKNLHP